MQMTYSQPANLQWLLNKVQKDSELKNMFVYHLQLAIHYQNGCDEQIDNLQNQDFQESLTLMRHLYEASHELLHFYITQNLSYRSFANDIMQIVDRPAAELESVLQQLDIHRQIDDQISENKGLTNHEGAAPPMNDQQRVIPRS
ncbi:hypothetical protein [Xanthocytophaga agilis]|uniref:Uncharacterized protein n=1 Tax=Xanthocytophaga agilis TaxID=3048010 RepID=A0AAE3R6Y6_9BACT|nr:hypothetical protein [Xanthocytophaga agilis]MDJ1504869.1 hypothetical protein [Xanthocytophaga agilis]